MKNSTFSIENLFTVFFTKSVDTTKNPPFLLSVRIVVDEELKTFLNSNQNTNFESVEISLLERSGYFSSPYADISRHQNIYTVGNSVPLIRAINEQITFAFEREKTAVKLEKLAIKAFKIHYKQPIVTFLKAKEALQKQTKSNG